MKLYFELDCLDCFSPFLLPQPKNCSRTYGLTLHLLSTTQFSKHGVRFRSAIRI